MGLCAFIDTIPARGMTFPCFLLSLLLWLMWFICSGGDQSSPCFFFCTQIQVAVSKVHGQCWSPSSFCTFLYNCIVMVCVKIPVRKPHCEEKISCCDGALTSWTHVWKIQEKKQRYRSLGFDLLVADWLVHLHKISFTSAWEHSGCRQIEWILEITVILPSLQHLLHSMKHKIEA